MREAREIGATRLVGGRTAIIIGLAVASGSIVGLPSAARSLPQRGGASFDSCSHYGARAPQVSSDSIGFLDLHQSVRELRALCPSARDTTVEGEETINPAVVFHLGAVTVVATQISGPANLWIVTGRDARLPEGLTLASKWGQLRLRYGRGIAHWEYGVTVQFCRAPRIWFVLNLAEYADPGTTDDLTSIPDTTSIREVWVKTGPFVQTRWGASRGELSCQG